MKILQMDFDDGIVRRVLRIAILSIPLAFVMGWSAILFVVALSALSVGRERVSRQNDVADKPFSFCLPRFRESLRRRLFIAAAMVGVLVSLYPLIPYVLLPLRHPWAEANLVEVGMSMVAAFGVGMVIGLILWALRFAVSRLVWSVIGLLSIPLFILGVLVFSAFVEYPLVGIPLCVVACVYVWFRLGDVRQVKRRHRMIVEDALERQTQMGIAKTVSPSVERLFRRPMMHCGRFGVSPYIWGRLYQAFGLLLSYWVWILLSIVGSAVILGYLGGWLATTVSLILGIFTLSVRLPVAFDGLWLPADRRERYWATVAVAVGASLLCVGAATLVTICSWVLSLFLSGAEGSAYEHIEPRSVYWAGVLTPWLLGWRLLRFRWPRLGAVAAYAAMAIGTTVLCFSMLGRIVWTSPMAMIPAAVAFIGGWLFFLLALRDVCMRASLIEPSFQEVAE